MREQLDITARVEINPEDWLWATWRSRNPLARQEPKPFDKKDALSRLEKVFVRSSRARQPDTRYFVDWQKASISSALSKQEAHFSFTAMTHSLDNTDSGIQALVQSLNNIAFTGNLSVEFVVGADMQPLVRDDKGKLLTNLPKGTVIYTFTQFLSYNETAYYRQAALHYV